MFLRNYISFIACLSLGFLGCSSPHSESDAVPVLKKQVLGSFYSEVNPATGSVNIVPVQTKNTTGNIHAVLDYDNTVIGGVMPENCSSSDWNSVTKTLSLNFRIRNVTNSDATYFPLNTTFLAPLEFRLTGIYDAACLIPITAINTDIGPAAEPHCGAQGMTLSLCDDDSDGCFDNIYPELPYDYADDPGWNFSSKVGSDNRLTPAEASECSFLQFTLASETVFGFYYDVLGYVYDAANAPPAPTVNPITSPGNNANPTVTGGCVTGNTVTIEGGQASVSGVCTSSTYSISVSLWTNQVNTLTVSQSTGVYQSTATVVEVIHDNVSPTTSNTSPQNSETFVSVKQNIVVTFNEPMKLSSFVDRSSVFLDRTGGCGSAVANGSVSLSADLTQLIFNPSSDLSAGCTYTFQVYGSPQVNSATDSAGNKLSTTLSFSLTTAAAEDDKTRPQVVSAFVVDNSRDASTSAFFSVTFSEPIDTSSIAATDCNTSGALANIALVDENVGPKTVVYSWSGDQTQVFLTPTTTLTAASEHSLNISSCVRDLAGNTLPNAGSFTNTVYAGTQSYHRFNRFYTSASADVTAPTLDVILPKLGSTGLPLTLFPTFIFSEPMDPNTVDSMNIYLTLQGDPSKIAANLKQEAGGQVIRLFPSTNLSTSTTYSNHVSATIGDYSGNNPASPSTSTFTTNSLADTTAPTVVKITPASGATGVNPMTDVEVWFSEPMDETTISNSSVKLVEGSSQIYARMVLAPDKQKLTITAGKIDPDAGTPTGLVNGTTYTVQVNSGTSTFAKDRAGNTATSFTSTFVAGTDVAAPTMTASIPANNATNIPRGTVIQLVMNERINPATAKPVNFQLRHRATGTGNCASTTGWTTENYPFFSVDPSNKIITINNYGDLTASRRYRVDFVANGLKDLKGNGKAAQNFCFTTSSVYDTTAPTISTFSPANGTTSQSTGSNVTVTFAEAMDLRTVDADSVFLVDSKGNRISAAYSYNTTATAVTLDPAITLSATEDYTVYVTTAVRDAGGTRKAATQSACFSTDASACP